MLPVLEPQALLWPLHHLLYWRHWDGDGGSISISEIPMETLALQFLIVLQPLHLWGPRPFAPHSQSAGLSVWGCLPHLSGTISLAFLDCHQPPPQPCILSSACNCYKNDGTFSWQRTLLHGEFPGCPVVRTLHFPCWSSQVQSLVTEVRSCQLCGAAKKKKKKEEEEEEKRRKERKRYFMKRNLGAKPLRLNNSISLTRGKKRG